MPKGSTPSPPISAFVPADRVPDPQALTISLAVNGTTRQEGSTADMIFPVAELVAYLSGIFTLLPGDIIFTGTPSGVSAITNGDSIEATLDDLASLHVSVSA